MWFQSLACLFILRLLSPSASMLINYNEQMCTVIYTEGYSYKNWYDVIKDTNTSSVDNKTVLLRFYVHGVSNAHIMLTPDPSLQGYEIIFGAGSNTYYDIRKFSKSVKSMKEDHILDELKPIGFWIRASKQSGLIEVGKDGMNLPFMFWTDPSPIPVKYFGFSSWGSGICKWLFKCQSKGTSKNSMEKVNHVRKFLTYTEQLKSDVLEKRGKFGTGPPTANRHQMLNVAITSNFKFIHLDIMTSTLTLRGFAIFEWTDDFIHWNPDEYNNISRLHLSNYELWQPELVLHNAMDPGVNIFSEEKITVNYQGNVTWKPKFSLKTKCNIDLKLWPWDRHKCTLLMSPWSYKISNIFYEIKENNHKECFQVTHSDWKLDRMRSFYVEKSTPWDDIVTSVNYVDDVESLINRISIKLVVEISRNTKILENLFYVPLILIILLWLSSFWLFPNSTPKTTIICVSIILSTSIVVYMTTYVPVFAEYCPPDLMLGYLELMLLISTDAFISSFLTTAQHGRTSIAGHPPFFLTRFLTWPLVTRLLVLPKLDQVACHDDNGQIDANDPWREPREQGATTLWDIIIVAFQRIVFVIYSVITAAVLLSIGNSN